MYNYVFLPLTALLNISPDIGLEWTVEWATPSATGDEYFENLVLSREQARGYGDELVMTLRVDEQVLKLRELEPREPFAWKIEDEALVTRSISRRTVEAVADGDRHDSQYARQVLENRAKRRLRESP